MEAALVLGFCKITLFLTGHYCVMLKAKEIRDRNYLSCPWVVQIDGKPVRDIDHGWKALVKRLGLEGLLFHDLRRTDQESSTSRCV